MEADNESRRLMRRPIEMKRWIVEETLVPGASVAKVARRHGVNANQVFHWRRQYREGWLEPKKAAVRPSPPGQALIRVGVIDHEGGLRPLPTVDASAAPNALPRPGQPAVPERGTAASGGIEIELPNGIKLRVEADIEAPTLRRVLAAARELP